MPPQRRARVDKLAQTLSERVDRDEALLAILSLLRRHPRGLSRRGIMRGLDVSRRQSIDGSLAVLVEKHLVTVHRSAGPPRAVYRCAVPATAEDKLSAAGK